MVLATLATAPLVVADPAAETADASRRDHAALWRESFNGVDVDGSGYTHEAPPGWTVEIDPAMRGAGVEAWGWARPTATR